jgi:PAS domain S-box-containing protein
MMIVLMIAALVCGATMVGALLWTRRVAARLTRESDLRIESKSAEMQRYSAATAQIEGRYRALFDSVPVSIMVASLDGAIIDLNRAAMRTFGYDTREEALTMNMRLMYVNPAERDRRMAEHLNDTSERLSEHLMRRKDGSKFTALTQTHILRDSHGLPLHIEGFVTDISDYKKLEEDRTSMEHEQRISQRLQSVGALAAGIAHEINTPMQFVSDSVYFLKTAIEELDVLWPELAQLSEQSAASHDASGTIQRIGAAMSQIGVEQLAVDANQSAERALDGIRRVTKIIRAMREFAHPDNGEHTKVDINNAIETTLTVCRNVYKEIAKVETDFGPLPQVMCQYGEINQVLLNIIVNAAHAIEGHKAVAGHGLIRIATCVEDQWAVIRITDNGTGIPESVKSRIFDPFFTTKEVGKGTGQGLAIVQSVIVGRHRGRISVESEVGKGTTFVLRLPLESPAALTKEVSHEQEA